MTYQIERRNQAVIEVDADGFDVKDIGGGSFLSSTPTAVHYIFWLKPSAQYACRCNVAAYADVVAVRIKPEPVATTSDEPALVASTEQ